VLVTGVGKAAAHGMLVKDAAVLERVHDIDVVVFDKTGTLTLGEPALTDVVPARGSAADVLALAAAAEQEADHPLAKAIVRAARDRKLKAAKPQGTRAMPGVGVIATVGGEEVLVGNLRLLRDRRIDVKPMSKELARLMGEGKTVVLVAKEDELVGLLALADPPRPEAQAAIEALRARKVTVALVTGDNVRTAEAIGKALGIERVFAEITPHGKAAVVRALQEGGKRVAMVGDGINDAPALAAADVGVAVAVGSDVAVDAADVVLLRSDPRDLPILIGISEATAQRVRENLRWAFAYNALLVPLAALGLLSPLLAGLAMAFSTIPVLANSVRLARAWQGEASPAPAPAGAPAKPVPQLVRAFR
jgi:Cu+-exporting ATPase